MDRTTQVECVTTQSQVEDDTSIDTGACMEDNFGTFKQRLWEDIMEGKDEVRKDNMSSNTISKSRLRYVPPPLNGEGWKTYSSYEVRQV